MLYNDNIALSTIGRNNMASTLNKNGALGSKLHTQASLGGFTGPVDYNTGT